MRRSWTSVIAGLALCAASLYDLATRWQVLWAGHPAFPITLVVAGLLGLVLIVTGLRARERRRSALRVIGALVGLVLCVGLAAALWWVRPIPATNLAGARTGNADGVIVSSSSTRIVLRPSEGGAQRTLVFYPGARIDPRAYVAILRPVAKAGTEVRIVKEPFNLALLDPNAASADLRNVPAERRVVAGHSLGGVVASAQAATLNAPLVLWASYPDASIRDSGIAVLSLYGSRDGLSTPADVAAHRDRLPPDADLVEVKGADHASFGDMGQLDGDHPEERGHAELKAEIAEASAAFLAQR